MGGDVITPPDIAIAKALEAAAHSPCHKSKRGVCAFAVIGEHVELLDIGYNGPPDGKCDGSGLCRASCAKRCVHAEMRAIRMIARWPVKLAGKVQLVHVKWQHGVLVPGGGPSCWQCSREILDVGIGGVWLFERTLLDNECDDGSPLSAVAIEDAPAWRYYSAADFHRTTLETCGIGGPR